METTQECLELSSMFPGGIMYRILIMLKVCRGFKGHRKNSFATKEYNFKTLKTFDRVMALTPITPIILSSFDNQQKL